MAALTEKHPPKEQLIAFGLGKLDEPIAEQIAEHLDSCHDCSSTVIGLKDDTFVSLVRHAPESAQADAFIAPSIEVIDAAGNVTQEESVDRPQADREKADLPHELRNHPRYEVRELIGHGGMGDVYQAQHKMMNRTVALKVIRPDLVKNDAAISRFRREVQAAAQLHHQNIVTAYDAEQASALHFLVMEYVDGVDLDEVVRQQGTLPISQACDFVRQAANGLQHAHEQGMVHRDIKPHNLMVTAKANADGGMGKAGSDSAFPIPDPSLVKILDFGLASLATENIEGGESSDAVDHGGESAQLTMAGTMMGTPDFMSPEQASDARSADVRSDIYALGTTFYYLLAGEAPFSEGTVMQKLEAHRHLEPKPIETVRAEVPVEVAEVVRRMMAKDPTERYQTPSEVADALAPFVDQYRSDSEPPTRPVTASAHGSGPRYPRRSIWHRISIAAMLVFLLLGGAAAIYYVTTNNGTLQIETSSPDVEVILRQNGEVVEIVDTKTDSHFLRLPTGKYEVELKDDSNEFTLSKDQFVLRRGERVIVRVTSKRAGQPWLQAEKRQNVMIHGFAPSTPTITKDDVAVEQGALRIDAKESRVARLYEQPLVKLDDTMLTFRANVKTKDLKGRAYLEMWVRVPGKGEFFSRGLHNALQGTNDWTQIEIPFKLEKGQYPDLVKLNVGVEGSGSVWIKEVSLNASVPESKRDEIVDSIRAAMGKRRPNMIGNVGSGETVKLAGLRHVTRDFMAAVVVHPQWIINKPVSSAAKFYLTEVLMKVLGVEMKEVEQVTLLFPDISPKQSRRGPDNPHTAVIRLVNDIDATAIVRRIFERPEKIVDARTTYWIDPNGRAAFLPDKQTIVCGPRDLVARMARSSEPDGLLAESLQKANLSCDVVGVITNTGFVRQSLFVGVATAQQQMSPDVAEDFSRVPNAVLSATVEMNLSPGAPISLSLQAKNDESAKLLERAATVGLKEAESALSRLGATAVPNAEDILGELALRTLFELINPATVSRQGDRVIVTSRTPAGLADVVLTGGMKQAQQAAQVRKRTIQLKQIGLAMHNYHDAHRRFPPADPKFDKTPPLLSWRVSLLPFLGESELYDRFHLDEPWDSPHNVKLLEEMPSVFKTVNDPTQTTIFAVVGPGTAYEGKRGIQLREITDGTANTVLAVMAEDDQSVPWTKPTDLPFLKHDPIVALGKPSGEEFQVLFGDGSVRALSTEIDPESLRNLLLRKDGHKVDMQKRRPPRPTIRSPKVLGLLEALKEASPDAREKVIDALEAIGRETAPLDATLGLIQVASADDNEDVGETATHAIAEIGEDHEAAAKVALPAMIQLMNDRQRPEDVRVGAVRVLGEIGSKQPQLDLLDDSVTALALLLVDQPAEITDQALWSLGEIGERNPARTKSTIPTIQRVSVEHQNERLRRRAGEVLEQLQANAAGLPSTLRSVVIEVRHDGDVDFNGKKMSLEDLQQELKVLHSKTPLRVTLEARQDIRVELISKALQTIESIGIQSVGIRMQADDKE